ncbi:transglycosylase SLT domain-containing protein [Zooshikella marina]|uniref:transglycosylase SLT domain-containing protein n=1 Tax=Zooshikella ganghwensis TaxID=202772 RepID=UPI001BB0ACD5|nr:transglycosylase SLT domain-containing protein [Zooshikella ganghwensis]MBU2707872.1 transglycosylase SLT domain-containing protein [Zooshikella ganghwensis]
MMPINVLLKPIPISQVLRVGFLLPFSTCMTLAITSQTAFASAQTPYSKERSYYQQAIKAYRANNNKQFNTLKKKLSHYPLYPYLEYYQLDRGLSSKSNRTIAQFVNKYQDVPLTNRLEQKWLRSLANKKQWQTLLKHFPEDNKSTDLQCSFHYAQLQTGNSKAAYAGAQQLWLTGKSLPKSCDPLLNNWRSANKLTPDLVWQRMVLAYAENQGTLGRYLIRYLPKSQRGLGNLYFNTYHQPNRLTKTANYSAKHAQMGDIISTGLVRLAKSKPSKALSLWTTYQKQHRFTDKQQAYVETKLAYRLMRKYTKKHQQWIDSVLAKHQETELITWRLRQALRQLDWASIAKWTQAFPKEERQTSRWQYWYARAIEASNPSQAKRDEAHAIYRKLADSERDFYGFLAADRMSRNYALQHKPYPVSSKTRSRVQQLPAVQRAQEFFQMEQLWPARREWYHMASQMNREELLAAAEVAMSWQWYFPSIISTARAEYWDDLNLRFPVAYKKPILKNSRAQDLDSSWVFAITRQESAFMYKARSHAGAMGLMQLMPATARYVARKNSIPYQSTKQLLKPETNIKLGSAYLAELYKQFNGNRILATAAYNAGPHRVNQWLKRHRKLPHDVWVEVIPFNETRKYVQNVLAYQVIYRDKLGHKPMFLTKNEVNYSYEPAKKP